MIERVKKDMDMLKRHLEILHVVRKKEPIGILKISSEINYPQHKVRYSLRRLEEEDLIQPTKLGAITTDSTELYAEDFDKKITDLYEKMARIKVDFKNYHK